MAFNKPSVTVRSEVSRFLNREDEKPPSPVIETIEDLARMIMENGSYGVGVYALPCWLTPKLAKILLDNNPNNRDMCHDRSREMAHKITAGNWCSNGSTISITDAMTVADGQHRCEGVMIANIPIPIILVFGVSNDTATLATIDQPGLRTVRDICQIARVEDAPSSDVIALSNLVGVITEGTEIHSNMKYGDRPTRANYVLTHIDDFAPWASWAKAVCKDVTSTIVHGRAMKTVNKTLLGALAYHLSTKGAPAEMVDEFYRGVIDPWSLDPKVLRELSENRRNILELMHRYTKTNPLVRVGGGAVRQPILAHYATHITAYNRYILDEPVKRIMPIRNQEYSYRGDLPNVVPGFRQKADLMGDSL